MRKEGGEGREFATMVIPAIGSVQLEFGQRDAAFPSD